MRELIAIRRPCILDLVFAAGKWKKGEGMTTNRRERYMQGRENRQNKETKNGWFACRHFNY